MPLCKGAVYNYGTTYPSRHDMLMTTPLQGIATSSNTIPSTSRSKERPSPAPTPKQWVNQSSGSCQLCEACRTVNLHAVSLCEHCTQLRVLQEAGSSALPACQRLVSATLNIYGRCLPFTRRRSNRLPSGPTQAVKKQKSILLIAARKGHINLVAE